MCSIGWLPSADWFTVRRKIKEGKEKWCSQLKHQYSVAANMSSGGEFVEGWLVAQVLGEGSYGEVRLLVHSRSGANVALKAVQGDVGAREAGLHRALRHPNVLRCLGERRHNGMHYLFLEYAQGGELFDRIEPDVGMGETAARQYWRQLIAGLQYLHTRGVAHRDIKPENLLLDNAQTLKISDFGMATLFRVGTRERLMTRVCGTEPYAAPEVLSAAKKGYRAQPADLWAAALVLLAMLAGELPWERASREETRFVAWCTWIEQNGTCPSGPWRKLTPGALNLLRKTLNSDPDRRPTLDMLQRHHWLNEQQDDIDSKDRESERAWSSQPCAAGEQLSDTDMDELLSYSQPAHTDDLLLEAADGTQSTQGSGPGALLQRLVRRMTRVFVRCNEQEALRTLADALSTRGYTYRHLQPKLMAIECGEVKMRAWAVRVCGSGGDGGGVMVEFRRSRGCGLAFKRRYKELREALRSIAIPQPVTPYEDLLAPVTPRDCRMETA
ncbi:unnamed protein product [Leptosia nina]|uniref:non-specific serine/threonine protein kinase n=1 Tax=Leptosia nina TaxID=320188 RepID=A0AAV1JIL2_9NEOP